MRAGELRVLVDEPLAASELLARMGLPAGAARRLLGAGKLACEERALCPQDELLPGAEVSLALEPRTCEGALGEVPANVAVLYQDAFLLALQKPAGMLVHSDGTGSARDRGCLAEVAAAHVVSQGLASEPQALHRLDVDTSGIVLFSLTGELQPAFDALVSGHGLQKRYFAVVQGTWGKPGGPWQDVEAPIGRDRHDAKKMRVSKTGKPAHTRVRCLAQARGRTLVEAELVTGRRHQIRVHLAHLGHAIVGDALYGRPTKEGLMLHAHEVAFDHPVTGECVHVSTTYPERFPAFAQA